jgi:hypothetical protein
MATDTLARRPDTPTTDAADAAALAAQLAPLWACRYVVHLRPTRPLALPLFGRGGVLRGGFGLAFRRQVCPDLSLDCRACPLVTTCAYPSVFETAPPPGAERLRTFTDLPRPFTFDPPDDGRARFDPGDTLCFGFVVAGRANRHLPQMAAAFADLGRTGLGPRRAPFTLAALEVEDAQGQRLPLDPQHPQVPPHARLRAGDLLRAGDATRTRLTLRFDTPLDLRDRGRSLQRPHFGALVRRLRDRAAALAAFFGEAPLDLDFRGLGQRAETVRLSDARTRRVSVERTSTRTHERHDVGGLLGEATFIGEAIGALMPLVRLGELIHVGRHAAFGNGRFTVVA